MRVDINKDRWFFCNKPKQQASMRLFCFPFSGGGASIYRSWPDVMGDDIEVCAIQLPGRESRFNESRETNINRLVFDIANAFKAYQDKPFAVFGYSLGALVAFEVCRELRKQGMLMPEHIFVAAMRAPQTPRVHPPLAGLEDVLFLQQIEHYYQPQNEAWNNPDLREIFLPVLKDDVALSDGYVYKQETPLSCPIDAFAGEQDIGAPPELVQSWSEQTSDKMIYHSFHGGHFFIDTALKEIQNSVLKTLASKHYAK